VKGQEETSCSGGFRLKSAGSGWGAGKDRGSSLRDSYCSGWNVPGNRIP